jgi:ribosomal protein L40E
MILVKNARKRIFAERFGMFGDMAVADDDGKRRLCESCGAFIPEDAKKCPKCGAKVGERVKYVAKPTVVSSNFIAEEIWDRKSAPKYMVYHFDEDRFETVSEVDLGETDIHDRKIVYMPVDNEALRKGLVIVPREAKEATWKELLEDADSFAFKCYDPCGKDAFLKLLVRVAVGSWFLDKFVGDPLLDIAGVGKFAPIIPIRGPSQSGKNRLAFVLRMLSYRPYFEMSTYRVPSLYRPLDLWHGTLVLDEADMANTTERSEFIHFLNCRATGTPISRQDPQNPKRTHVFCNFGLTILTQRKQFDDNATESRCLPFYSEATDKQLPTVETDDMLRMGLELQDKLLWLRMKFYREVIIDKSTWLGGLSDPRLNASLLPLVALSKYEPSIYETIVQTAKDIERLKIEEKSTSEDGLVVNYLWEKIQEGLFECWNNPIFYVLQKREIVREKVGEVETEREVKIPLTTTGLAEHFKWSPRTARKVIRGLALCRENLSNRIKVGGRTYRVILFDPRKLEKRLREFVVDYEPNSLLKMVTLVTEVTLPLYGSVEKQEEEQRKNKPYKESVTSVTSVTSDMEPENEPYKGSVTSVTSVTSDVEPDFLWRPIPEAERCELCGKAPVAYEINDVHGHQILRRCANCFQKLRQQFANSVWKQVGGT